jgi:hypothetical protein
MGTEALKAQIPPKVCPFCGVATGLPHETQEGCIRALKVEIARVRDVLDHVRPLGSPTKSRHQTDEPDQ